LFSIVKFYESKIAVLFINYNTIFCKFVTNKKRN
jgi:hypothetical protein